MEEKGLEAEPKPLKDEPEPPGGGSTDVAEVSRIAPVVSLIRDDRRSRHPLAQLGRIRLPRDGGIGARS